MYGSLPRLDLLRRDVWPSSVGWEHGEYGEENSKIAHPAGAF